MNLLKLLIKTVIILIGHKVGLTNE